MSLTSIIAQKVAISKTVIRPKNSGDIHVHWHPALFLRHCVCWNFATIIQQISNIYLSNTFLMLDHLCLMISTNHIQTHIFKTSWPLGFLQKRSSFPTPHDPKSDSRWNIQSQPGDSPSKRWLSTTVARDPPWLKKITIVRVKWSPYKWPYKWLNGVIRLTLLLIQVITSLITGLTGPIFLDPCGKHLEASPVPWWNRGWQGLFNQFVSLDWHCGTGFGLGQFFLNRKQ